MHPLSLFPQILFLGPLFAPLLFRLLIGGFIIFRGWQRHNKTYKWACFVYALPGLMLILGLYTQALAIVGVLVLGLDYYVDKKTTQPSLDTILLFAFCVIILISLIFTGPGLFAFDLPI